MTVDIQEGRPAPDIKVWDLPAWGHPLARTVLPLFIRAQNRLYPAGTAFWVGRGVGFIITAMHNVTEALKLDGRFDHALSKGALPAQADLKNAALYVLHIEELTEAAGRISFVPLENINGATPGDVVFGYPMFENGRVTGSFPLSFDPPRIGETVWSVGYRNIHPVDGLPFDEMLENRFDLLANYRHQLTVVEGVVERIFVQRFARGFLEGPCFSFDQSLDHGLSGGPVFTTDGRIVGINSAGGEMYFNRPATLASMLYPLLMTKLRYGAQIGPVRLNAVQPLFDLIGRNVIASDGSETHVSLRTEKGYEGAAIGPRIPKADHAFVHDDFAAFDLGIVSQPVGGSFYRLVRPQADLADADKSDRDPG